MIVSCDKAGIETASGIINGGGVAVFPTDTVYGLGCDPYAVAAVQRIYDIKSRDITKALPVLTSSVETAEKIVWFDDCTKKIVQKFWPGPLTVILKVTNEKIKKSLGLHDKIAIRVPDHKCTLEILQRCDFLVGTSANLSGDASYTDPKKCMASLQGFDVFVDGGVIRGRGESTIIEVEGRDKVKIIREGSLTKDEILES